MPAFVGIMVVVGVLYQLFFRYDRWPDEERPGVMHEHDNLTGKTNELGGSSDGTASSDDDKRNVYARILAQAGRRPEDMDDASRMPYGYGQSDTNTSRNYVFSNENSGSRQDSGQQDSRSTQYDYGNDRSRDQNASSRGTDLSSGSKNNRYYYPQEQSSSIDGHSESQSQAYSSSRRSYNRRPISDDQQFSAEVDGVPIPGTPRRRRSQPQRQELVPLLPPPEQRAEPVREHSSRDGLQPVISQGSEDLNPYGYVPDAARNRRLNGRVVRQSRSDQTSKDESPSNTPPIPTHRQDASRARAEMKLEPLRHTENASGYTPGYRYQDESAQSEDAAVIQAVPHPKASVKLRQLLLPQRNPMAQSPVPQSSTNPNRGGYHYQPDGQEPSVSRQSVSVPSRMVPVSRAEQYRQEMVQEAPPTPTDARRSASRPVQVNRIAMARVVIPVQQRESQPSQRFATHPTANTPLIKGWTWQEPSQIDGLANSPPVPGRQPASRIARKPVALASKESFSVVRVGSYAYSRVDLDQDGRDEEVIQNNQGRDGLMDISIIKNGREVFFGRGQQIALLPNRAANGWSDIALQAYGRTIAVFRYNFRQESYVAHSNSKNSI